MKYAVVTGGTSGMGVSVAKILVSKRLLVFAICVSSDFTKQNIYKKIVIHRFAIIEEIVGAFHLCIENPYVNGSLIEINGGYNY